MTICMYVCMERQPPKASSCCESQRLIDEVIRESSSTHVGSFTSPAYYLLSIDTGITINLMSYLKDIQLGFC